MLQMFKRGPSRAKAVAAPAEGPAPATPKAEA
jgi:hypothetical protein